MDQPSRLAPLSPPRRALHLSLCLSLGLSASACHLLSGPETPQDGLEATAGGAEQRLAGERDVETHEGAGAASGSSELIERSLSPLIARVNGEGIPESDFLSEYEERVRTYRLRKREVPPRLALTYKRSVMNQLINDALVRQALKRHEVTLSAEELDRALSAYKARFRSEKNFQSYLQQSQKTADEITEEVRFEARLEKLILSDQPIELLEDQLIASYEEQRESRFTEPAQARVRHILISAPHNASKRQVIKAKRAALKVLKEARRPDADFSQLAQKHSDDSVTKSRGGDLGLLSRKGGVMFDEAFEAAAAQLPLQTPSEPVLSSHGWHILKVTDRQPEQLRVSQILLKGPQALKKAKKLARRALSEPFAELARSASQDEASRVRGGDIDFLHPKSAHRFGERFKEQLFKLKRGDLSVIESAQGAHVVLVTDARPMRVRVSHILLASPQGASPAQVKALKAEASALYQELSAELKASGPRSSAFTRLARKRSDDKRSKLRGGDIGHFYIGGEPHFSREVEELIFTLKPGELSEPVRSPYGWHLLKVEQRKEEHVKTLAEVREELSEQLRSKQMRRQKALFMQRLKSEAKIERFLKLQDQTGPSAASPVSPPE